MSRGRHRARRRHRLSGVVLALVTSMVVLVLTAGAVLALMTVGSGAGAAGSATNLPAVTLTPAVAAADLKPGGQGALRLVARNPGDVPARIARLTLDTGRGIAASGGCPLSAFGFTAVAETVAAQTNDGRGWEVPPRSGGTDGSRVIVLEEALTMSATAPEACQGTTVTVYLRAEV